MPSASGAGDQIPRIVGGQRETSQVACVVRGVAELADPTARPLGRQPQPVLDRHADSRVQLVGGGDHGGHYPAQGDLRDRHRIVGLRAVEAVIRGGDDGEIGRGPCSLHISGHRSQRVLHHLKRAERTTKLLAFPGVGDGELDGSIQCADDLHAARPGTAPRQLRRSTLDNDESI